MKKHCCEKKLSSEEARELLVSSDLKRTKIKINILLTLSKSQTPLSVFNIHQNLGIKSCNISSIFRAINQFKEKTIIKEVNLGEDFFRYELNSLNHLTQDHHHHHIRCRDCGNIKLIEKCDLEIFEKSIAKLGFKKMEHHLEFTGICAKCS